MQHMKKYFVNFSVEQYQIQVWNLVFKNLKPGLRLLRFKSWLCHQLALRSLASYCGFTALHNVSYNSSYLPASS